MTNCQHNDKILKRGDIMLALEQIKQSLQSYNKKLEEMSVSL